MRELSGIAPGKQQALVWPLALADYNLQCSVDVTSDFWGRAMPGGRERNIMRWEAHASLLRNQLARLDERLVRLSAPDASSASSAQRDELLAQRADVARQLDALGPDPRAKMG
jgi:hypothetical protein